jgi:DtxR family Mn-dependent transcriptional regulator
MAMDDMERQKITPTVEDYLEILYVFQRDGEPIVGARLADLLGVSPPTVTNTLKRMARDGLLEMDAVGPRLSEQGIEAARSVTRRHMLTEWMLSRMIAWSKLHTQAHGLEHAISNDVELALLEQHDQPEVCPHGNPLPGYEAVAARWQPLTQTIAGEKVIIRRVHEIAEQNPELMAFLEQHQITPGQAVSVGEILEFNQTVTLKVEERPVTLGFAIARYIFVEREGGHARD